MTPSAGKTVRGPCRISHPSQKAAFLFFNKTNISTNISTNTSGVRAVRDAEGVSETRIQLRFAMSEFYKYRKGTSREPKDIHGQGLTRACLGAVAFDFAATERRVLSCRARRATGGPGKGPARPAAAATRTDGRVFFTVTLPLTLALPIYPYLGHGLSNPPPPPLLLLLGCRQDRDPGGRPLGTEPHVPVRHYRGYIPTGSLGCVDVCDWSPNKFGKTMLNTRGYCSLYSRSSQQFIMTIIRYVSVMQIVTFVNYQSNG